MVWLTRKQLKSMGFASLGEHVLISDKASIYGAESISIGNHVRIDDFCVLSAGDGGIHLGNYIHIAVFSSLIGQGKIVLENFCGLSSRVSIYSSNDDYSGVALTNPMVPDAFKAVTHGSVVLEKHVIIGSGSIVLPNVRLGIGCAIGALTLVTRDCEPFGVYWGVPAKRVRERKRGMLELEISLLKDSDN
ncbi:acyltransferase [Methylohalobius crimeensis]|uniref:acyltransferase n=1 Tax=Methylohalobius crimeensis TaxID=244365 RepID=UPI000A01C194|nr:acyltransferase [Methylohalobius crimeensis]